MANRKVKSDYTVLKKFNQKTDKGDVFERDIMTINPLEDLFTPGQDVITSDSNFKFSIRTDKDRRKKHSKNAWIKNKDNEEIWHLTDVDSSPISDESIVRIKPDYNSIKDFAYYGSAVEMVRATVNHVIMYFPAELYFSGIKFSDYLGVVEGTEEYKKMQNLGIENYYVIPNDFNVNVELDFAEESKLDNPYRFLCLYANEYDEYKDGIYKSHGIERGNFSPSTGYTCGDGLIGHVTINGRMIFVESYKGNKYLLYNDSTYNGYSFRPGEAIVNEYYSTIDEFESILVNMETKPIFKTVFETPYETDEGNLYRMQSYIWPSMNNWNPVIEGAPYEVYIGSLINLASFHDEYDSNILWRMLTHEAIKNLDWTFFRENGETTEDLSHIDSSKIEAIIQLYGRQFDGLKRYIDNIKFSNNVTYNEKNNVPDYLLTDLVELGGFNAVLPIQTGKTDVVSDNLYPDVRTKGYSEVDMNTFFMRILKLNEPYLNSIKGTRYGIETMLRLLGVKKDEYDIREYVTVAEGGSTGCTFKEELSNIGNIYPSATGVKYPSVRDTILININKEDKTLDEFDSYFDGIAVKPYCCMDRNKWIGDTPTYYVIPWYENGKRYDGNWYFQSKGGWAKSNTEKLENNVVESGVTILTDYSIYDESESSLKYADDVFQLRGFFKEEVKQNMVCYVTDLTTWEDYIENISSHYFILKNIENIGNINENGWRNIPIVEIMNASTDDGKKVLYLENVKETTEGNNPHISNDEYDDGDEYVTYMNKIFRYQINLGDEGLIRFSKEDKQKINEKFVFNISKEYKKDNRKCDYFYNTLYTSLLSPITQIEEEQTYAVNPEGGEITEEPSANSVINLKNMELMFLEKPINNSLCNDEWQDYITNVVMKYVKQMIPSTTIFKWGFVEKIEEDIHVPEHKEEEYFRVIPIEDNVEGDVTQTTFRIETNMDLSTITPVIED